jgi:hypothetical protein
MIFRGSSTLATPVSYSGRSFGNLTLREHIGTWTPSAISGTTNTTVAGNFTIGATS